MVSLSYLQAQLDKLRTQAKFNEVFQLKKLTDEELKANQARAAQAEKEEREKGAKRKAPVKTTVDFRTTSEKILEKRPEKRNTYTGGEQAAGVYGLPSLDKLVRLQEYLQTNGGFHLEFVPKDGTCKWESVLRCLNHPKEYQYMILQRQVVLTATEHPDFFCELLEDHIKGQYGPLHLPSDEYKQKEEEGTLTATQKQDQFLPGPFSFITYLEYLLKDGTWGDYRALLVISMNISRGSDTPRP